MNKELQLIEDNIKNLSDIESMKEKVDSMKNIKNQIKDQQEITNKLIKERREARDNFDWDKVKMLTKQIRKSIRKDRTDALVNNLEEI